MMARGIITNDNYGFEQEAGMQITAALLLLLFFKPSPSVAVCACVDHILQLPESGHLRQAAYLHRTKAFVLALSRYITALRTQPGLQRGSLCTGFLRTRPKRK